jgi:hypothetical protein
MTGEDWDRILSDMVEERSILNLCNENFDANIYAET